MTKSKPINESLALELKIEFERLGNILGDYLMFLELKAIGTDTDNQPHIKQLRQLLDCYASRFDKILSSYKVSMTNDIRELTTSLLVDLKKQTTIHIKH